MSLIAFGDWNGPTDFAKWAMDRIDLTITDEWEIETTTEPMRRIYIFDPEGREYNIRTWDIKNNDDQGLMITYSIYTYDDDNELITLVD